LKEGSTHIGNDVTQKLAAYTKRGHAGWGEVRQEEKGPQRQKKRTGCQRKQHFKEPSGTLDNELTDGSLINIRNLMQKYYKSSTQLNEKVEVRMVLESVPRRICESDFAQSRGGNLVARDFGRARDEQGSAHIQGANAINPMTENGAGELDFMREPLSAGKRHKLQGRATLVAASKRKRCETPLAQEHQRSPNRKMDAKPD